MNCGGLVVIILIGQSLYPSMGVATDSDSHQETRETTLLGGFAALYTSDAMLQWDIQQSLVTDVCTLHNAYLRKLYICIVCIALSVNVEV